MANFNLHKVVSTLPSLDADTLYAVRVGAGFDLYISDNTGSAAHKVNTTNGAIAQTNAGTFSGGSLATGEIGVDETNKRLNFSTDGSDVIPMGNAVITVQPYSPSASQGLTTTYEDVDGSSIDYSPFFDSSKIIYRYNLQVSRIDASGMGHFKFLVDGSEVDTDWRKGQRVPTGDTIMQFEALYNNATASTKTLKMTAREYDSASEIVLHALYAWDGSLTSDYVGALLTIIEIPV